MEIEKLKKEALQLGKSVPEIEEIWAYEDTIIVVGGEYSDVLSHSNFEEYVGMCRRKTSLYDSVSTRGTLLYSR